jgi:nucleoside-diphosphate-sugar epimerase
MKRVLVTGACGQIGSELVVYLRSLYGNANVLATDIKCAKNGPLLEGPFETLDVLDAKAFYETTRKFNADTVIHLAALLSAVGEINPQLAWKLNMGGLVNGLETARELKVKFFTPSSIGSFGPSTPKVNTPQDTLQRPETMYGVTKVSGELLCDYYNKRFGVDTRGVRFPGLISYVTPPGGGTTDYAVDIFYKAAKGETYSCFIKEGTYMDMMYMPDALNAVIKLLETDADKLKHRNAFNITAMSFAPEQVYNEIRKILPDFKMIYDVDPVRQKIAESWPDSIDSSSAAEEWGFSFEYDLPKMTKDMLEKLK